MPPSLGGMGGGGGPRRGAALLCRRPCPASKGAGLRPRCRPPRPPARPVLLQQRAAAAGRSAGGRRCRYPAHPWPVTGLCCYPCRAIAHNPALYAVESHALTRRITTGYVPELPQQRRDTIALPAAAIRCGPRLRLCLISGLPAAVCGVRRHRRQDGASAASSREPVQLRCRGSWSEGSGESR